MKAVLSQRSLQQLAQRRTGLRFNMFAAQPDLNHTVQKLPLQSSSKFISQTRPTFLLERIMANPRNFIFSQSAAEITPNMMFVRLINHNDLPSAISPERLSDLRAAYDKKLRVSEHKMTVYHGAGASPTLFGKEPSDQKRDANFCVLYEPDRHGPGSPAFCQMELLSNDSEDGTLNVRTLPSYTSLFRSETHTRRVPDTFVYGGWPTIQLELATPVRLIRKQFVMMWPDPVTAIKFVRRDSTGARAEPIDEEMTMGSLMRADIQSGKSYHDVRVIINDVECDIVFNDGLVKDSQFATGAAAKEQSYIAQEFSYAKGPLIRVGLIVCCFISAYLFAEIIDLKNREESVRITAFILFVLVGAGLLMI